MKWMTLPNAGHGWARAWGLHWSHQVGNDGVSSNRFCPVCVGYPRSAVVRAAGWLLAEAGTLSGSGPGSLPLPPWVS